MEIIFLLIVISLVFIALMAAALYWAIKSGQFEDMERHGYEILMDDDKENSEEDNDSSPQ